MNNFSKIREYITESTSGDVLRSVKTQFLLENIQKYENLLSLIKNKYHTEQFDLIDSEDLEVYINDLLDNEDIVVEPEFMQDNEDIVVEPEFMQDNEQENYKIVVKVKGEDYV